MSVPGAAVAGPTALWYLTRATGAVTLMLLTLSVALGVADVRRAHTPTWPRFVVDAVHRNASLLALAFLLVHVVTSVLDTFAPIRLVDSIVPFTSAYRPLWLGLGALASDLLIAVALTSVFRRRLGYGTWRAAHWLAYACWPVAVLHGLGTGSDTKTAWMLSLTAACVLVVLVAVWVRATAGWPERIGVRISAIAASTLGLLALIVWLPSGPLAAGWASRAGTPSSLLPAAAASGRTRFGAGGVPGAAASPATAFLAQVSGTVRQGELPNGLVEVALSLAVAGQHLNTLDIRIDGEPLDGGGVQMTASAVTLGTASAPTLYRGTVTALQGASIEASVRAANGGSIALVAELQIDPNAGTATGTLNARPAREG